MKDDFDDWITRSASGIMDDTEIALLAEHLAGSGQRLNASVRSTDLASTGGPGSLSTLWGPIALVAMGRVVPKLGVPGRPAGGVDVLAQIQGYRVALSRDDAELALNQCNYVHALAGTTFAPADAAFFAFRQSVGAQAVPALATASLLAKKLAMGVQTVGLEVRVAPHGNFGADISTARQNAHLFCRVAAIVGLEATCILTDGEVPQQPYLGRGEALLALSLLFSGKAPNWLERHATACEAWAATLTKSPRPSRLRLANAFAANLHAQGGSVEEFEKVAARIAGDHEHILQASRHGVVNYDLGQLRAAITAVRASDGIVHFDDSAGIILLVEPGHLVRHGEPVLSARCPADLWPDFKLRLSKAIGLSDIAEANGSFRLAGAMEVVRVGNR